MTHFATPLLALLVSLLSLAHALPPLAFEVGGDASPPDGWVFDLDSAVLEHEVGEARLQLRHGRLLGVVGVVEGGPEGAAALSSLVVAASGGGEDLARALEHHLSQEEVPAFTRIGNALLTLREEGGRVAFDFALIELAPGDFRGSRHVLNPDGSVPVRVYSDFAAAEAGAYALSVLPAVVTKIDEVDARLEYHHAPAALSGAGVLAAEASECVAAAHPEGGFWAFHDLLARERATWVSLVSPQAYFVEAAGRLGLDAPGLAACIEERLALREVSVAAESAANLGLTARPTVFVGGFLMTDPADTEELERLVLLARPAGEASVVVPLMLESEPTGAEDPESTEEEGVE